MKINSTLIKGTLINFLSSAVPFVVAVPCFAILARSLDESSFNSFLLMMTFLGYLHFLDFGFSKYITKIVAEGADKNKIMQCFVIILFVNLIIFLFSMAAYFICFFILDIKFNATVRYAIFIAILTTPFYIFISSFQSFFEGLLDFYKANTIKIVNNSLVLIFPTLVSLFLDDFFYILTSLVFARLFIFYIAYCIFKKKFGKLFFVKPYDFNIFNFGGWLTISNVISPLMVVADKFFIAERYSATISAPYTLASEIVMRLLSVPGSMSRALFPLLKKNDKGNAVYTGYLLMFIFSFFIILPFFVFSDHILFLWLGKNYVSGVSEYLNILLIGLFLTSISQIPYNNIQFKYGTKITSIIHMLEFPLYIIAFFYFVNLFSVKGAAIAWTLRVGLDFFLLFIVDKYLGKISKKSRG